MNPSPRMFPVKILQLEALESRLSPAHKEFPAIKSEAKRARAGWYGEISMDYHYRQLDLPRHYHFIHQLRLSSNMDFFQMDTLLLTSYFFLILEMKNLAGHVTFDHEHQQMIRALRGQQEAFTDPVLQVQQQAASLRAWIAKHFGSSPPIYTYVVMVNDNSILQTAAPHTFQQQVIRPLALRNEIHNLFEKERNKTITAEIEAYASAFKKAHTPARYCAVKKYNIDRDSLKCGVLCPACYDTMKWGHGKWVCTRCKHVSRDAHHHALNDYALLFSPHISTGECQTYLQLPSIHAAQRLLKKMNLRHSGGTKSRKYHLFVKPPE